MGIEMSVRDQKGRTRPLDRVEGSVSLEYIHSVATNLYTFRYERSDELGGMAVNDLWIRRGIANLLDPNGMAGSEIVDAP